MGQVLPFQVYLRAPGPCREGLGQVERRRAARVVGRKIGYPGPEGGVGPRSPIFFLQFIQGGHQRLGMNLPPKSP